MADNPYAKYVNPYAGYVPVGVPDPTKPLDLKSKQIGVQKGEAELALTPYQLAKQKADAAKAELDLKTAQEAYDAAHPKGTGSTVLGPDSLKSLSAPDQELVKALAEGRLAFPGGFALKAPWWQQKLEQVAAYDPSFDATNFNARAKARASAIAGKLGASNNALNTAIGHLGQLYDQVGGTASHNFTPLNSLENFASKTFGSPGVTNFEQTAGLLADELEAAYRNGGGAEQGVVRQLRSLNPDMSREQKLGVIHNAMDLLTSKIAANAAQYNFGTGGKPAWDMLDQHTRETLQHVAPDLLDKYFAPNEQALTPAAISLLKSNGGTPPSSPPPAAPPTNPNAPPPVGPHGPDYSGMVGGNAQSLATGQYRNVFDPTMAATVSAMIRKGVPYDTALAYAQSHGANIDPKQYAAALAFQQQHPNATPNVEANKMVPTTVGERLASSPLAAFAAGAGSAATAGLADTAVRSLVGPEYDANRAALAATNQGADLLGNVVGGAAGMFGAGNVLGNFLRAGPKAGLARNALALALKNPMTAGTLGDTAYGAVYGANENPDNPLAGAGVGAIGGLAGGAAGNLLTAGSGKVLQGVVNPAVQRLRDAGIPLTAGEVLGGGFKKAQDALTSVFGPGNMVSRRYADGRQALNQLAFDQAGQIVGRPVNAVGQKGIEALNAIKDEAYSNALNPVQVNLNNPQTVNDLGAAIRAAKAIPNVDQASDIAGGGLANYIGNAAPNGVMSGPDFQQAYRGLSRLGRQSSSRIYGHEIGQALGQGQDALVSALESQNPGAYADFLKANSVNRHLSVLSDAVNAAKNQLGDNGEPLFTPAQLGTARTANARIYNGKVAAASGQGPFNQLAKDAQQVMSSRLNESGTAPREFITRLATTGAIAGGGGMFGGHENGATGALEGAAVPLGLLTLLGTRRGQQLLTASLLNRTAADKITGRYLSRNPQVGGDILTAAGIPLLTGP